MAPTKQQGPKKKFLKKVQSFSDTLYSDSPDFRPQRTFGTGAINGSLLGMAKMQLYKWTMLKFGLYKAALY
jgi:hypothetical protein